MVQLKNSLHLKRICTFAFSILVRSVKNAYRTPRKRINGRAGVVWLRHAEFIHNSKKLLQILNSLSPVSDYKVYACELLWNSISLILVHRKDVCSEMYTVCVRSRTHEDKRTDGIRNLTVKSFRLATSRPTARSSEVALISSNFTLLHSVSLKTLFKHFPHRGNLVAEVVNVEIKFTTRQSYFASFKSYVFVKNPNLAGSGASGLDLVVQCVADRRRWLKEFSLLAFHIRMFVQSEASLSRTHEENESDSKWEGEGFEAECYHGVGNEE